MEEIVRKARTGESVPNAARQDGVRREIVIEVEAETLERQRKLARVRSGGGTGSTFEMICDEGTRIGGDDTAPSPLAYFSAGIAF